MKNLNIKLIALTMFGLTLGNEAYAGTCIVAISTDYRSVTVTAPSRAHCEVLAKKIGGGIAAEFLFE